VPEADSECDICFHCGYPSDSSRVLCHTCQNDPTNDPAILWWVAWVTLSGGRFATMEELMSIGED